MGYFSEIATVNFKKDAAGRDVFYPFGIFGKGRILSDAETARRLRSNAALVSELTMFVCMAFVPWTFIALNGLQLPVLYIGYSWLGLIVLSAMVSCGMWLYNFKITRGLPASSERISFGERWRTTQQIMSATRRSRQKMTLAVSAVTFGGVCVPWLLGMSPPSFAGEAFAPGFFLVLALICLAILLRMIAADRRRI